MSFHLHWKWLTFLNRPAKSELSVWTVRLIVGVLLAGAPRLLASHHHWNADGDGIDTGAGIYVEGFMAKNI